MQKRKMFLILAIALIVALALPLGVSAQGNEIVAYTYAGQTYTFVSGHPVFQPGDTTTTGKLLSSSYPFSVQSYANRTAMENGNVLGRADAEYVATLLGDEYTLSVQGTTAAMWLEVIVGSIESDGFWYDGTLTSLHNGHLVVPAGDTQVTPQVMSSNAVFVVVNYLDAAAVEASTPAGSLPANCTTLVGQQCTVEVRGTDASMMLEILPASTASGSVTATVIPAVVATTTPNPLLGEVTPIPAQSATGLTPSAVVFPSASNTWVWGPIQGQNPMIRDWQITLSQLGVTPALWQTPPNVDNPLVDNSLFPTTAQSPAPWGIEWPGTDLTLFCQQDTRCDEVISAQHIRYYTGNLEPNGMGSVKPCHQQGGIGCMLIQVNSNGETDSVFTDQGFIRGYTFQGRYWDGNHLGNGLWGLISFGTANMTNQLTNINQPGLTNAGGNCSTAAGCIGTYIQLQFLSGGFEEGYGEFLYIKP